ncbi:ABC transporter substrate-binding protein [Celerinatantimonas diazotrophica]|uniref:Peptide/nickel transport system substrate-binding protein n=1 Tax=Celerinatantimonas diazotrophica TaxID=412034 RepID=A0A4V2PR94_9GAMM|nr:ABC transporter substrate-binding protein [Celerinatantimonas diazotrophica]TCK57921.1 peptide/nickel transport system substrate-binding protein [Celerinatantimonas diazotrophica]CAG9298011.1 putative D,D-dipeptide-binding periplasmic protein DdpA [Celerinatantimonas diazotrophica]
MRKLLVALCLALSSLAISVQAATPNKVIVVAQSLDDIISLDPGTGFELSSIQSIYNTYQRLIQPNPKQPTQLIAGLAQSWKIESHQIVFDLKPGATFASGNPVRPQDVIFSLTRVIKLNQSPAFILAQLGWNASNVDNHVKQTGPHQVTVSWDKAISPQVALAVLSAPVASVIDEKTAMSHAQNHDLASGWLKMHSAGSGAYSIKRYIPHKVLLLQANPTSPGGAPKTPMVLIKNVPDASTRQLLVEQGDADIARNLGADQIASLAHKAGVKTLSLPYATVYYLMFNTKASPTLANPKFWQAARWAFDYRGIAHDLMRDQFQVHQSFLPIGFKGALTHNPYHFDPSKAKQILQSAGIETPHFTLLVNNQPPFADIAQALQDSFAKAGIKVTLHQAISSQVASQVKEHNYQATINFWGPDYFDPHTNASAFAYNPEDGQNKTLAWRANWHIPKLNQQTLAALAEPNPAKRTQMYKILQTEVRDNSPFVIALQTRKLLALREYVKGFIQGTAPGMVYYQDVTK